MSGRRRTLCRTSKMTVKDGVLVPIYTKAEKRKLREKTASMLNALRRF